MNRRNRPTRKQVATIHSRTLGSTYDLISLAARNEHQAR